MGFKNKTKLGFIVVLIPLQGLIIWWFSQPSWHLILVGSLYLSTFIPQIIVSKNKAYSMPIKV